MALDLDVSSNLNHKYKLSEFCFAFCFLAHRAVLILLNNSFQSLRLFEIKIIMIKTKFLLDLY